MKRRLTAAYCLLLFVVGTLVLPAVHKWELANETSVTGNGYVCSSGCCSDQTAGQVPGSDSENSGDRPHHDADSCQICQMAHMPIDISTPIFIPVSAESFESSFFVIRLVEFEFKRYRISPFSCGPPC